MAILSGSGSIFATNYYTTQYHTDISTLSPVDLSAAKLDRFYIELAGTIADPSMEILSSGTADFYDTGDSNPSTNVTDATYNYATGDVDPNHLEMYSGSAGWANHGAEPSATTITLGDGKVYDLVGMIETFGLRFDSSEVPYKEGSAVAGYTVIVIDSVTGLSRVLFFPMADQDLSKLVLPDAIGQMAAGAVKSVVTHADELVEVSGGFDYLAYAC